MRLALGISLTLLGFVPGCTGDDGDGSTGDTDGTGSTDGTTAATEGSDSGSGTGGGTAGTAGTGGSSGAGSTGGGLPPTEYPECSVCGAQMCVIVGDADPSVCGLGCEEGQCPPGLTGTAEPTCVTNAPPPWPDGVCMLACSAEGVEGECPDGMSCVPTNLPADIDFVCAWP